MEPAVILFDGVCNLCNASVRFVIPRDPRGQLRFAALQSDPGRALQERLGLDPEALDGVVLVEADRVYQKSSAVLRAARRLSGAWPLLGLLLAVPRPLRDWAYDRFAERRYRWFGRSDACLVPTPEIRERFLG